MIESLRKKRGANDHPSLDAPPSVPWAYPLGGHSNLRWKDSEGLRWPTWTALICPIVACSIFHCSMQIMQLINCLKQISRCQRPSSLHCYPSPWGWPHAPASVVRHSATVALPRVRLTQVWCAFLEENLMDGYCESAKYPKYSKINIFVQAFLGWKPRKHTV